MKLQFALLLVIAAPLLLAGQNSNSTPAAYRADFDFFWKTINEEYSYFNKKQTQWQKVKDIYSPRLDSINGRDEFVTLLEDALYEIYDHHAILNTNTKKSHRLVPSGTDTWAEYINGKPIITEVRKGFGTASTGVMAGMEVIAVNDIPVQKAVELLLPRSLKHPDTEAKNFALRLVLAGDHVKERKFTLQYQGKVNDYYPDKTRMQLETISYPARIETRLFGNTGYIRINDCLYDNRLIPDFDSVMKAMQNTSSLIIDLRETPGGGNTSVARAMLGWFITKEQFYQRHEYVAEEKSTGVKRSWTEIVSPRKGKYYGKPLVILCDHWTASLGEAIVIGFDALKRSNMKIIGTPMARLYGAVYSFTMPNTKIGFTFPAERLYHVNGVPRENYVPGIIVDPVTAGTGQAADIFIARAIEYLKNKK